MNDTKTIKHIVCAMFCTTTLLLPAGAFSSDIEDVRVWQAPDYTRIVFDLSGETSYELFTLNSPERVVIDFKNTALAPDLKDLDN